MAYIVNLEDASGVQVFPKTVAGALYTTSTTTLIDELTRIDTDINDKVSKDVSVADRVIVSDSGGLITPDDQISTEELHALNGISSNIQTQLNGKQPTIYIWKLRKSYSGGLSINGDGKVLFENVYSDSIVDYQGRSVSPIPSGASIYGCEIVEYAGYNYGLNCILHPNGSNAGNIYLCGIPSAKIETVFGDSVNNKVSIIQIWVPYTI